MSFKSSTALIFKPYSKPWDSLSLLNGLGRANINLSDAELNKHIELLKYDMKTEFDSVNFDKHINCLKSQGLTFSPEFLIFKEIWQLDEWNHYIGYRKIYSMCTSQSEESLHSFVSNCEVDFSLVGEFFQDEFMICLVLAYDEIFTTRSCQMDFESFKSFGNTTFLTWIKKVARDEIFHFFNIIEIIRRRHSHRIQEASNILEKLIEWDLLEQPYKGTFVLDHDSDRFTFKSLNECKNTVLKYLGK